MKRRFVEKKSRTCRIRSGGTGSIQSGLSELFRSPGLCVTKVCRDRQEMQKSSMSGIGALPTGADGASINVVPGILVHCGPPKVMLKQREGPGDTRVAGKPANVNPS